MDNNSLKKFRQPNLLNDQVSPEAYFLMAVTIAFSAASLKRTNTVTKKQEEIATIQEKKAERRSSFRTLILIALALFFVSLLFGWFFL